MKEASRRTHKTKWHKHKEIQEHRRESKPGLQRRKRKTVREKGIATERGNVLCRTLWPSRRI